MRSSAILSLTILAALLFAGAEAQAACRANSACKASECCAYSGAKGAAFSFACYDKSVAALGGATCMTATDTVSSVCGASLPVTCEVSMMGVSTLSCVPVALPGAQCSSAYAIQYAVGLVLAVISMLLF